MRLIGKNLVKEFQAKHPTSAKALDRWVKLIETHEFKSPNEFKRLFGVNVDFVAGKTVFDVGGNKVRTITLVEYGTRIVLITAVLTHKEYDKGKWKG